MKKHIICLGDSNTHGYCADPTDCADGGDRFNEQERWPRVLEKLLGDDYLVLEEGLSGRTTVFPDPLHEGMPALDVAYPILMSHEPVDLLIIMLGTNDLLQFLSPEAACEKMERFLQSITVTRDRILLIAPPPMKFGEWVQDRKCIDDSITLANCYRALAERLGILFDDAGEWNIPMTYDGVHMTEEGHRAFAWGLIKYLQKGE